MGQRISFYILLIFCFSCQEEVKLKHINAGIYHWKSNYSPSQESIEKLERLSVNKEFVRFFDVDIDKQTKEASPKSLLQIGDYRNKELIPVVFITNSTLTSISKKKSIELGISIYKKIQSIAEENSLKFTEIQIDCDWTKGTQLKYFSLLEFIKNQNPQIQLSATIRLHQIKFMEQTGIPPVNRGTLMLYNVGDWTHLQTENSLFDTGIIDQYVDRLGDYPIALDLALPIYNQTIVFRNKAFLTYRKNIPIEELENNASLTEGSKVNQFICQRDSTFYGQSFRKGDIFRYESVDFEILNQVKKSILKRIRNQKINLLLFDLDNKSLRNFSEEQLFELFNSQ